jgi:hypothetical protein
MSVKWQMVTNLKEDSDMAIAATEDVYRHVAIANARFLS